MEVLNNSMWARLVWTSRPFDLWGWGGRERKVWRLLTLFRVPAISSLFQIASSFIVATRIHYCRMNTKIFGGSHYSCFCPLQHGRNYDSIPPLEECWRYLQRGEAYGVQYSDSQVVVPLLLILAGDIEVNPGPGKNYSPS